MTPGLGCAVGRPGAGGSVFGGVAQLGEHLLCKQGVIGSNPFTSTKTSRASVRRLRSSYGKDQECDASFAATADWRGGEVCREGAARCPWDVAGFVFFKDVNQVLVRLWACRRQRFV